MPACMRQDGERFRVAARLHRADRLHGHNELVPARINIAAMEIDFAVEHAFLPKCPREGASAAGRAADVWQSWPFASHSTFPLICLHGPIAGQEGFEPGEKPTYGSARFYSFRDRTTDRGGRSARLRHMNAATDCLRAFRSEEHTSELQSLMSNS